MMKKYLSDEKSSLMKMAKKKLVSDQFYAIAKQIVRRHQCGISEHGIRNGINLESDIDEKIVYARSISVSEFLNSEKSVYDGKSFEAISKIIEDHADADLLEEYEFDAIFVTFCILHECGHIHDSDDQDLYSQQAIDEYNNKKAGLKKLFGVNSLQFHARYHLLPQERNADYFAISKLAEELNHVTTG